MEEKPKIIVVKKVRKDHGGHHGGSWKVAYADFVTAMMAFFLLLWLLSMVSPEKRAVMALYFKYFSLFERGGQSFMQEGGMNPLSQTGGQEYYETGENKTEGFLQLEDAAGKVMSQILEQAQGLKENVVVDTTDFGVRIQIVDRAESPVFLSGSPQLTEVGKKLTRIVADTMRNLPNEIVVEGHTDSSVGKNEPISNWELSSLRACNAKKELESAGIQPAKISRVVGYAERAPLIRDNPLDPRNRRISIIFLYGKKQAPANPYEWVWKTPPASDRP
ncbi:MAG: OmpA family protein [Syntrophobacteraceae bacterium]|nr:OmpA family protein [Syntrophobacteraceae bacterium]